MVGAREGGVRERGRRRAVLPPSRAFDGFAENLADIDHGAMVMVASHVVYMVH